MGFRCPVCDDPQADAGHLANHLAITALTRGGDHEAWLEDNVSDWETLGEQGLAKRVQSLADDADYPQVFEDTTDQHGSHSHGGSEDHAHGNGGHGGNTDSLPPGADMLQGELDEDTEGVLREAMEMTQKRQERNEQESSDPDNE